MGTQDVAFRYRVGGVFRPGLIEYVTIANNADFDGDGDVDGADFLTWQRGFGTTSGANPADGDANGDGAVNAADLTAWKTQFGTGGAAGAAATAVPEPSAIGLVSLVLVGLAVRLSRRTR